MSDAKRNRLKNFEPDMLVFTNRERRIAADILLTAGLVLVSAGFALSGVCERRFYTKQKETADGITKLYEFAANAAGGNI